jgi:integrase
MSALAEALADYLAVRRAMGYQLTEDGRQLARFVAHLEAKGINTLTVAGALEWASATPRGGMGYRRLRAIRGFARYLQALEPAHEVPPTGLLPVRTARPVPHLYSEADVTALMQAARALPAPLWGPAMETIIGLLWATGLRVGEALRLNVDDLDAERGVLTVWLSKFNKSRLVPVAPSTVAALDRYRHQLPAGLATPALFIGPDHQRATYSRFNRSFVGLVDATEITAGAGRRPRAHDLRHSFAVRTLIGWYGDGADVAALLPRLSTYLGHVEPASTYWSLSAAPELMTLAALRLEPAGIER